MRRHSLIFRLRKMRPPHRQTAPEEIFAAAYIFYPRYFNSLSKASLTFEEALDLLAWMRTRNARENRPAT